MAKQKQDDQPELTYSSYVRTQDVTQKTCRRRWTIGKSGERWSRISVLAARLDDDDIYQRSSRDWYLSWRLPHGCETLLRNISSLQKQIIYLSSEIPFCACLFVCLCVCVSLCVWLSEGLKTYIKADDMNSVDEIQIALGEL